MSRRPAKGEEHVSCPRAVLRMYTTRALERSDRRGAAIHTDMRRAYEVWRASALPPLALRKAVMGVYALGGLAPRAPL